MASANALLFCADSSLLLTDLAFAMAVASWHARSWSGHHGVDIMVCGVMHHGVDSFAVQSLFPFNLGLVDASLPGSWFKWQHLVCGCVPYVIMTVYIVISDDRDMNVSAL